MSVASAVAADVGESLNKLSFLRDHHPKTLDTGRNGRTVSCGAVGDILQLSSDHSTHGMVVACPFAQFDGTRFYDPGYVRDYRKKLHEYVRSGSRGFGIQLDGHPDDLNVEFLDNQGILFDYSIGDVRVSTTVSVDQKGEIVQSTTLTSPSSNMTYINYTLDMSISVNRASYGQLTEGGPIPMPPLENHFRLLDPDGRWAIINPHLDAIVEGSFSIDEKPFDLKSNLSEDISYGKPVNKAFIGKLQLHPWQQTTVICTFKLQSSTIPSHPSAHPPSTASNLNNGWRLPKNELGIIIRRNLDYILDNCTIPVGKDFVCFIADHIALPLGWNRDNYWQIRFLLDVYQNLNIIAHHTTAQTYAARIHNNVKGHLEWVFRLAQKPHGYWHRSYLATGVPKDGPIFQLDQQCYPLLELCDFYHYFPCERRFVASIIEYQTITQILETLETHRNKETGLYLTEETPGDDTVEHPFQFSSHVLLWYTYERLATLLEVFQDTPFPHRSELNSRAALIKHAILKHFITTHPKSNETLFTYLTDGAGNHTFYHDANDVPTLFALDWKFINTPHLQPIWTQTMDFAFSPLNEGGYYAEGEFGGLGSMHTKGPWPLGYAQEFVYAHLTGNHEAKEDAWRRIKGAMFWDGLFPEAVDCHTGDCVSRAWFSWPGSMIGSALLRFGLNTSSRSLNWSA